MTLQRGHDLFLVDLTREVAGVVEAEGRRAAVTGSEEIDRSRRVAGRPGRDGRHLALLARGTPVGDPRLLAVATDLDRRAAAEARLAVAPIDGHALGAA